MCACACVCAHTQTCRIKLNYLFVLPEGFPPPHLLPLHEFLYTLSSHSHLANNHSEAYYQLQLFGQCLSYWLVLTTELTHFHTSV